VNALLRRSRRHPNMTVRYEEDLRLLQSGWQKVAIVFAVVVWLAGPTFLSDFQLLVLNYAGAAAIGAVGLNLLTGFTGQVSLGHAFFLGVGAYAAAQIGGEWDLPLVIWLPLAAVAGGLLGALIGPFALRLRGNYLVIVTLGLLFLGDHIFKEWESLTGGLAGRSISPPLELGPFDFSGMDLFGETFRRQEALFWLIWFLVGLSMLLAKNIVRTRPGRAMQAVRDRDLAAEVIGVSLGRYKVGAFAISSAFAAVAGAMYGAVQQYVSPTEWSLFLSIQFIAIIIIGGLATVYGSVIGAVVVGGLPRVIEEISRSRDLPFVQGDAGGAEGFISVFALNQAIFGLLIVLFLILEPRGIAAAWFRIKAYFRAWPFSY